MSSCGPRVCPVARCDSLEPTQLITQAEYVQGLGEMFADGRLTAEKLVAMSDEEVTETLVAVRGIGIWTVQMALIFVCAAFHPTELTSTASDGPT